MAAYFFDSSALVKRFASETGSAWLIGLFRDKASTYYAARITVVEVSSAIVRKVKSGEITPRAGDKGSKRLMRAFEYPLENVEITRAIVSHACDLTQKYLLRGYDAVQLAAALAISVQRMNNRLTGTIFVSADDSLNRAALAEGLAVENPNNYP